MIKKIIIMTLFTVCFNFAAEAGFWSALKACFTDPCNCGDSDPVWREWWNGENKDQGKKNRICPPWNKTGGRGNNTCLSKVKLPGWGIGYYENLCGEETQESSYLQPKIRVRGQQCNVAACWTTSNELAWDGECVTLAGGYGFPLHRMCARIAIPANDVTGTPQDPGYTAKEHLNFEGATIPDEVILDYNKQPIDFNPPKLCLYKDPSFVSIQGGFDIMDLNPNKQSFHKTNATHPIIKVIIFFVEITKGLAQTPFDLLSSLFGMMGGNEEGQTTFTSVLSDSFKFLGDIIKVVGDKLIGFLKDIGQINRVVDDTTYGCVNIPMGPYPPPFCPTVSSFFQTAYTQKICPRGPDGISLPSTPPNECVVSTLNNNFVSNAIRITFKNFIPICKNGENPLSTDKCVELKNLGILGNARDLHANTAKTDILPLCSKASAGTLCINTKIANTCSVSANGCQDGFRIVYGTKIGNMSSPKSYFTDGMADCPSSSSVGCQEIWGINTSEFVDVPLTFPAVQGSPDVMPLTANVSLKDKNGDSTTFNVKIVRVRTYDSVLQISQNPNQICVTSDDALIGCENRVPIKRPLVYECGGSQAPISCTSSYYAPKFIATITDGGVSTSVVVKPKSVYNASASTDSDQVNLAGYTFGSFVTDETSIKPPFSGSNSPNPGSVYGTYKKDIPPMNSDNTENEYAIYSKGLEYINNEYYIGGKYACLQNQDIEKCPTNEMMCVLTKLKNANIVRCTDFVAKLSKYPGLTLCSKAQKSACTTVVDSLPGISGPGISIFSCPTDNGTYCYTSPGNLNLCEISSDPALREVPSASLGATISDDSQYYKMDNKSASYDMDKYSIRDKTSFELNLCTNIPQPKCAAISVYNEENGYASWPETVVGETAIGSCEPGKTAVEPLVRRCVPNPNNQSFEFEPLYDWNLTGRSPVKEYGNVKCK